MNIHQFKQMARNNGRAESCGITAILDFDSKNSNGYIKFTYQGVVIDEKKARDILNGLVC